MSQHKEFKRYTITSALPYANGPIHIGHLAGVYIPADIYARYLRSKGRDVLFIGGSDEHGVPITIKAKKEGLSPQKIVDRYHKIIKDSFQQLGISFDVYSRTSSDTHKETASTYFKKLHEDGFFEEKTTKQFFDVPNQQFLADRYITGTCPRCKSEGAYGDQCENCGSSLSPMELINPKSALSGEEPILKKTTHWYLPLDKQEGWLKQWILQEHQEWKSNVLGQCKSWLDSGLHPRAVTRDLDWGVPVPIEGADGKVLYVWFDAPIGYISASKEWSQQTGKDWNPYWKNEESKLVHFIGKDNIVFHCIIFPTMLKAHGEYILPENVPANEFLNLEGNKLSTSKNWAIWLHEYLEDLPGKEDILRYVLCATAPETKDNDFTWKDYQARNNNELVAVLGNFINRVVVLTHKYYDGEVPRMSDLQDGDKALIKAASEFPAQIGASIETYRFREALGKFMDLARLGNKYLAETEPWKLIKTDPERVATIMHISLQIASMIGVLAEPFLPFTAKKLRDMLNIEKQPWDEVADVSIIASGHKINEAKLLFEKIEDEMIERQLQKLNATKDSNADEIQNSSVEAQKQDTDFDSFLEMDIRIGTVLKAEKVAKSNKLLKFLIDTGIDERTVLSGIAKYYSPEEMIGKQVSLLVNLPPRKIMGELSQGMILMAEDEKGQLRLLQPNKPVNNGARVS